MLLGGAALEQGLPLMVSPILTRLYTPTDFGVLAVFMALVGACIPAVMGRYELALLVAKRRSMSLNLFVAAIWVGLAVTATLLLSLSLFQSTILKILNSPLLRGWLLLVPVAVFAAGLMNAGINLANRDKKYWHMAGARVGKGIGVAGVSLTLGVAGIGYAGLLAGSISGFLCAIACLYFFRGDTLRNVDLTPSRRTALALKRYKDYAIYLGTTDWLDGLSLALPALFIAQGYSEAVVGYFALVQRVMSGPLNLFGRAVSRINIRAVAERVHSGDKVLPHFLWVSSGLSIVAVIPAVVLIAWGPPLFSWVFGNNWEQAGMFAKIMAPALSIRFVASTMSGTLAATRYTKILGAWKISAFSVTLTVLWIFSGNVSALTLISILAATDVALYCVYFVAALLSAVHPRKYA